MQCKIEGISHKGEGIARIDGKAVFIPFAIPGETVKIKIIEEKKNYNRAQLIEVIESSIHRVDPSCPHYNDCGGCSYQHIDYDHQLELKREVVQSNIARIGKIDLEVNPVIGSPQRYRYRNKVTWHIDKEGRLGYYQASSNELVEIKTCKLISEKMEKVTNSIREHITDISFTQQSNLIIRESSVNEETMLILTHIKSDLDKSKLSSFSDETNSLFVKYIGKPGYEKITGSDKLTETSATINISLSPGAFFQVNHEQMEKIISIVEDFLDLNDEDILLDAYSGVGSIALALASKVKKVVGVESFKDAVKDAKLNANQNKITNAEFIAGACETVLPKLNKSFDKVVLDPPRSGLKKEVIEAIVKANPKKIAYVSCNPATLARDLAIFKENDYITKIVQPLDMFAQTGHVECVVLMTRQ
ncbi:MAG TPA: 23S rRNA (uracil(1939)-C(5))-methyltransferase RlmD [Syntrophomonadaceae bacterium]|nr:23S rRNA (uracil(1939)-C(5))-methyltransferase RlmD [Syntrophomonadaceae bacterium]